MSDRDRLSPLHAAAYRRAVAGYRDDPVGYATDVLGQVVTPQQAAVAAALLKPPYRALVPAGHEIGKTHLLGCLANWHHDTHAPGVVIATAPTLLSLTKGVFKELRLLRPFDLGLLPNANEVRHRPDHYVLGTTTNKPDAVQGKHAAAGLILVDEATGVTATTMERAGTMFKGRAGWYFLACYNPYDPTTVPYALEQAGDWAVVRLSQLDHPNVRAGRRGEPPPVPGAVDYHKLAARVPKECDPHGRTRPAADDAFEWPPESGRWWVPRPGTLFAPQVLGRWPAAGFDAVWTEADWQRCLRRVPIDPRWPAQVGCDASRFGGDKTAVAVRRGPALVHLEILDRWRTRRPSAEILDRVCELCHRYAPPGVDPKAVPVLVDDTGGYGSGVCDHPRGYAIQGVTASAAAARPDRFANVRAELWWTLRLAADDDLFAAGGVGPGAELVPQLGAELRAARSVRDGKRRWVVEGKDAMRGRLGRSPDLADAVNLAYYPPPPV